MNIGLVEILYLRYEDDMLLNMNQILFLALNLGTEKVMICLNFSCVNLRRFLRYLQRMVLASKP